MYNQEQRRSIRSLSSSSRKTAGDVCSMWATGGGVDRERERKRGISDEERHLYRRVVGFSICCAEDGIGMREKEENCILAVQLLWEKRRRQRSMAGGSGGWVAL